MAEKTFKLEVITPDRVVFSDAHVVSVVAPGIEGYLGVLANHASLMTEVTVGHIEFRMADGTKDSIAVAGGFLEVFDNKVTVLAGSAETRESIDIERAKQSEQRAKDRLSKHEAEIDADRARAALVKAINRLRVAGISDN